MKKNGAQCPVFFARLGEDIRIISARKAAKRESAFYRGEKT
jgi:uncharacterized DUF497 family protein